MERKACVGGTALTGVVLCRKYYAGLFTNSFIPVGGYAYYVIRRVRFEQLVGSFRFSSLIFREQFYPVYTKQE